MAESQLARSARNAEGVRRGALASRAQVTPGENQRGEANLTKFHRIGS